MKYQKIIITFLLSLIIGQVQAQYKYESHIPSLEGERWWGGAVALA